MSSRAESNSNTQRISEERRFDRGSWLMLALASAVLLYSIALALYVALLPTLVPYLLEHWAAFTGPGWEQEDDTTTIILQCVPKVPTRHGGNYTVVYHTETSTPTEGGTNMSKIAVVTGANQGLGLALVRRLCHQLGPHDVVYLTARDRGRGEAAVQQLRTEGVSPQFHLLDVTDDQSVTNLAVFLKQQHGGIDILISNAAARITPDVAAADQVAQFINTNNHGTYRIITAFLPLLHDGARFVVVASAFGSLQYLPSQLHHNFDVERLSLEGVEAVMDDYVQLVQADQASAAGWPDWINIPSKIGQVAALKVMARMMRPVAEQRDIVINAVCPGLVDTEASRPWFADMSTAQSPDQAAVDVVWLATLPAGTRQPYGELVQHRQVIPWK